MKLNLVSSTKMNCRDHYRLYAHQRDTKDCKCTNIKIRYIQWVKHLSDEELKVCRARGCRCKGKHNGTSSIVGCHIWVWSDRTRSWVTGLVPGCNIANSRYRHEKYGCQQYFDERYVVLLECPCGNAFPTEFQRMRTDCNTTYMQARLFVEGE